MSGIQQVQVIFMLWTTIFCIIAAIIVLVTRKFDKNQATWVMMLLIVNGIINIFEAFAYLYRGDVSEVGYWMVRISNFVVFLFNGILLLCVLNFLVAIVKKNGACYLNAERYAAYGFILIYIIVLILSRIFHFYYDFNEKNEYYRLDSYWIMLALSELIAMVIILLTIKNWKHLKLVERIEFMMFEILPIVGVILQTFIYGISITTVFNTISIFLVFLTYELEAADYAVKKERRLFDQMISAFAKAIDKKDKYTGGHSSRVAKYSVMIAERIGLSKKEIDVIWRMALLHDIGKIGIPDAIINKTGKLTDEEFAVIKSHPAMGSEILETITEKPELLIGARWHHERFDGKGYPDHKKGHEIPLEARIIGMADSYDAMTSNRSYRSYLPQEVVRSEVEKNAGTQFDPDIAQVMLKIIDGDENYKLHE
jgi:putative nucleotidyltransferase with HDIG domain